jgi:hypothetical protein
LILRCFLGGLHRQATMQAFADAKVELARVRPLREGFGDLFSLRGHVSHHVGDQVLQTLQRRDLVLSQPRQ